MKSVFIAPFDPLTKITTCLAKEWVHKTPEQGESVILEAKDDEAVIAAMKADPAYCWLEDVEVEGEVVK